MNWSFSFTEHGFWYSNTYGIVTYRFSWKTRFRSSPPIEFEGPGLTRGASYHGGEVSVIVSSKNEVREIKAQVG